MKQEKTAQGARLILFLFVFVGRDDFIRQLGGQLVYAKRLEKGKFAKLWAGEDVTTIELTMSELQLFLEGSRLVGKVAVSPGKLCLKCLTDNQFIEKMEHVEAGGNNRRQDPPASRFPP